MFLLLLCFSILRTLDVKGILFSNLFSLSRVFRKKEMVSSSKMKNETSTECYTKLNLWNVVDHFHTTGTPYHLNTNIYPPTVTSYVILVAWEPPPIPSFKLNFDTVWFVQTKQQLVLSSVITKELYVKHRPTIWVTLKSSLSRQLYYIKVSS